MCIRDSACTTAGKALEGTPDKLANNGTFLALEVPSASGVACARALGAIAAALSTVDDDGGDGGGGRVLSRAGLDAAEATGGREPRYDHGLSQALTYTDAGWCVDRWDFVGLPGWTGWAGTGGSMIVWSRARRAAFAYVPTMYEACLLYTSPSPRDGLLSRMPSSS